MLEMNFFHEKRSKLASDDHIIVCRASELTRVCKKLTTSALRNEQGDRKKSKCWEHCAPLLESKHAPTAHNLYLRLSPCLEHSACANSELCNGLSDERGLRRRLIPIPSSPNVPRETTIYILGRTLSRSTVITRCSMPLHSTSLSYGLLLFAVGGPHWLN